jgi:hypothetical protein
MSGDRNTLYWRSYAFLASLFRCAKDVVKQIKDNLEETKTESIAAKFREVMTEGQTFKQPGSFRKTFFDKVVKGAKEVCLVKSLVTVC